MPDVHIPAIGNVDQRWVYGAGTVVAGIAGVAWWRKRQNAKVPTDTTSTDGTYAYGDTTASGPGGSTDQYGTPLPAPIVISQNPAINTNSDWLAMGESLDLGGVAQDVIATALTHVLGGIAVTQAQADIFNEVCGIIGYPPQGYPKLKLTSTPIHPPVLGGHQYTVQFHQFMVPTSARAAIQRFSDASVSTPNAIETALKATVADSRNGKYHSYYSAHGGKWPAKAGVFVHVVKKK